MNITMDNTALGRGQMKKKQDFAHVIQTMKKEEWEATLVARESIDSATTLYAHDVSDRAVGEVQLIVNYS